MPWRWPEIIQAAEDIEIPLSEDDIRKDFRKSFLKKQGIKIVSYMELRNYQSINELLYPSGRCMILYEYEDHYGHWTCLFKTKTGVNFFDSYGIEIDSQLLDIPENYRGDYPHLTYLLYRFKTMNPEATVDFNEYALQEEEKNINTCGKWCVIRMYLPDISNRVFARLFQPQEIVLNAKGKRYKIDLDPDLLVSLVYNVFTS